MAPPTTSDAGRSSVQIDEIGYRILQILRDHGRISMAALAQEVGISRASAYARVNALTQAGVITGYQARVDPERAGLGLNALVFVTVRPQTWAEFIEAIRQMPEIESAKITTGEHDAMLHIRAPAVETIHSFVVDSIAALPQVKSVVTVLVLDEIFDRGYVLPTDLPQRAGAVVERGLMRYTRTNPDRPSRI